MTKKTMKKGLIAAIFSVISVVMFSGCELLLLGALIGGLSNALTDDVKNDTPSTITFRAVPDPSYTSDDSTTVPTTVTETIRANETKKKALTAGYYKIYVNDKLVLPQDYSDSDTYYYITGDKVLTIRYSDSSYYYTLNPRS